MVRAPLAALALTVAVLAGCSGQAPGTAAVVDGQRISEDQLAAVVEQLNPYLQQPLTPAQALGLLIESGEIVEVAADSGLGVSEQQALTTLEGLNEQLGVEGPDEFAPSTILVARGLVAAQTLAQSPDAAAVQQQIADQVAAADVTVSPRYGSWDGAGAVVPSAYDWIVAPAAAS